MPRRPFLLLFLALCAAAPATAQQADTLAWTRIAVAQRGSPDATAAITARLPAGTRLRLYACEAGWCRTRTASATLGYVRQDSLTTVMPAPATAGKGYTNSQGQHVDSPRASPSGPPRGATAQCRDGTYSFSQSRSGTCSRHGGVARWL